MPKKIRLAGSTLALATFLAFSASDAAAQMCIAVPGSSGQNVIGASIGFPSGANIFGVDFHHHLAESPLTLSGMFEHWNFDSDFIDNQNRFGARLAYDMTGAIGGFPDELGFCLVGGLTFGRWNGINIWEIPLGVSFGGAFDLGEGGEVVLMPFAAPLIYHTRVSNDFGSDSDTDLDIVLGATMVFTQFHVGLDIQRLFRDGSSYLTLRFGLTF
jgi:hypothetical protein